MSELLLGQVTHFFNKICVAALALRDTIAIGDQIRIRGRTTDFEQKVLSLQIDHRPVTQAGPGDDVALEVLRTVRQHDRVFKVVQE